MQQALDIHPDVRLFWETYDELLRRGLIRERRYQKEAPAVVVMHPADVYAEALRAGLPMPAPSTILAKLRVSQYRPFLFAHSFALPGGGKRRMYVVGVGFPEWMHGHPEAAPWFEVDD